MTDTPITTYFVLSKQAAPASWALPTETKKVLNFAFDAKRMPLRSQGLGVASQGGAIQSCTLVFSGIHPDLQENAGSAYGSAALLSFRELTKPPFQVYRFENLTLTNLTVLPPEAGGPEGTTTTVQFDIRTLKTTIGGPANR